MSQYKIFQPLVLAFYSKSLYRDVGKNWLGRGFLYLTLLSVLVSVVTAYYYFEGRVAVTTALRPLITQLPTVTVQEGNASIKETTPYLIKDPQSAKVVAVIDTSGDTAKQSDLLSQTTALFVLTKNNLLVKESNDKTTVYNLSAVPNGEYDQATFHRLLDEWSYVLTTSLFVLVFLLRIVKFILIALILAGLAKIFTHTTLNYQALCRLAAIALTPAVILSLILEIFAVNIPYVLILYAVITLSYLFYGIEANKEMGAPQV